MSPACNSDISTDCSFSPFTVVTDGKQPDSRVGTINIIFVIWPKSESRYFLLYFDFCTIVHDIKIVLSRNPFNGGNSFDLKINHFKAQIYCKLIALFTREHAI